MIRRSWIFALALALALVFIFVLPSIVSGDSSSGTVVVSGNIAPTVTSVNPNSGLQGNTNLSVTISGSDFTGATSVSFGQGITVSYVVNSTNQITASITVASNATPGARDVSVTVAGATGAKSSAFTVVALAFSITAPSGISLGNMIRNNTATGHSGSNGSVSTNSANWQVVVQDANTGNNSGHMLRGGSHPLLNQLQIGKSTDTCSTNAGDSVGLIYTPSDGTSLPFYVQQAVDPSDTAGAYTITIAFTGSVP